MCPIDPAYTGTYRPTWGYQYPPVVPPTLPSLSTTALQDIVEGQQRATNGLVTLLSQERTTTESSTREHKQQLSNITSLSQNFLTFMPDVEHKFSALESSIRSNCTNPDNVELQNRVNDMVEVIATLGRIAEGFASSTGLRLVPSQGLAPSPWSWVPVNSQPLQQDPTSFSATFPQAPRLFPAAIPNSSRSSVFAHSTGPSRSVHWPSDLDVPTTSWAQPSSDPYFPVNFGTNTHRASRSSLYGEARAHFVPVGSGCCAFMDPPGHYTPTVSESSPTIPSPESIPYVSRKPFGLSSPSLWPPVIRPPTVPVPRSAASSPSQTESVVGSMRRTSLSPITERTSPSSGVPPPPAFGRMHANGPSPSTSSTKTVSTPTGIILNPPTVPQSRFSVSTAPRSEPVAPPGQIAPHWFGTIYPRSSSTVSSDDEYSITSPPHVEIPNLLPADTVRWSSLFPTAPIVVERPGEDGLILRSRPSTPDESIASPMSSPVRSVISYADSGSIASEPMTPLSRVSGKFTLAAANPKKLTNYIVDSPKAALDETVPSTSVTGTAAASTSNAIAPSVAPAPPRNPLAIQLVSFFFDNVQRLFKVPAAVELSYSGFEVSFSTASIPWVNLFSGLLADDEADDGRLFELMPAPANAALHRYIKDLARVRMDLAALQAGEDKGKEDPAVEQLVLRVKAEQNTVQSWMKRVCAAAGALSIADPAFSPRK